MTNNPEANLSQQDLTHDFLLPEIENVEIIELLGRGGGASF
jgi:hypothetical protein